MSPKDVRHFLNVYRVADGIAEVSEYAPDEYEAALGTYRATEEAHRDEPNVEVVLLSADSHESLMATRPLLQTVAAARRRLRHRHT